MTACSSKIGKPRHLAWERSMVGAVSFALVIAAIEWVGPTISRVDRAQLGSYPSSPSLQATATPAPSVDSLAVFQITLAELGYDERTLVSPWGDAGYSFRLPDYWLVESGSYLDLEFSYSFNEFESGTDYALLGKLSIYLDGRLLETYPLSESSLEHIRLRLDLPPELFIEQPGASHQIRVLLDAWFLCDVMHQAQLVVHPETLLSLNYTALSPNLDLADYPRPFSQQSFGQDHVCFVLPIQPSEQEVQAAALVAAKLGDLTSNQMIITATTDVDFLKLVDSDQVGGEHLFVIGQPAHNRLITWLDEQVPLPIPVSPREMALSIRGPGAIGPSDVFTYTITVTNTTSVPVMSLTLTDQLPRWSELVDCRPRCDETDGNKVDWSLGSMSPGEADSFSLTLQLAEAAQRLSLATALENVVVLTDETGVPLNVGSLTTAVDPTSVEDEFIVSSSQDGYFFTQNGQPVPETDGILQEVVSPWHPRKVVLLVTGANDKAIYKAGRSLGSESHVPNMQGPAALVREIRPTRPVSVTMETDQTLADLGYSDRTIYGIYDQEITYWFRTPWNVRLTGDAYVRLLFSHSGAIDGHGSTLTVLLNDYPLSTVYLNRENAAEGIVQAKLLNAPVWRGSSNKLSVLVSMELDGDRCANFDANEAWVNVSQSSMLHLDYQVLEDIVLDLDDFPYPFSALADLRDVLFVLPPVPGSTDQEALVQVAATLGNAARGTGINPLVSLGETLDAEMLSNYHVIAIGRPSTNPLIRQVNTLLPQPFVPGTDEVEHQIGEVILRLPPGTPLGYIQELSSPWNERKALLLITGTADDGVAWAVQALVRRAWRLSGNLALVRKGEEEIEIQSVDTRDLTRSGQASAMATALPELTPVATVTPTPEIEPDAGDDDVLSPAAPPSKAGLPTWVLLFVGLAVVAVLATLGVAIRQFRKRQGG